MAIIVATGAWRDARAQGPVVISSETAGTTASPVLSQEPSVGTALPSADHLLPFYDQTSGRLRSRLLVPAPSRADVAVGQPVPSADVSVPAFEAQADRGRPVPNVERREIPLSRGPSDLDRQVDRAAAEIAAAAGGQPDPGAAAAPPVGAGPAVEALAGLDTPERPLMPAPPAPPTTQTEQTVVPAATAAQGERALPSAPPPDPAVATDHIAAVVAPETPERKPEPAPAERSAAATATDMSATAAAGLTSAEDEPEQTIVSAAIATPPTPPEPDAEPTMIGDELVIVFPAGDASLPGESEGQLSDLADSMGGDGAARLQLKAFASADGSSASAARRLSLSRALAVRSYLIDAGVQSTRIDVRALGAKFESGPPDRVDIVTLR